MKKLIGLALLTLLTSFKTLAQTNFLKDSLDNYINHEMQRWQIPGVAIAIIKD